MSSPGRSAEECISPRRPGAVSLTKRISMLPIKDLDELAGQPDSGICKVKETMHVALHPRYLGNVNLGLVHHFNKKIGTFVGKLDGILTAYDKLYLRQATGGVVNDSGHVHVDVISNFWLFRPVAGSQLSGVVVKKSLTHVSCLVHDCFTVSCCKPRDTLVQDWCGTQTKLKQIVRFTLIKCDISQRIPVLMGSLQRDSVEADHPIMCHRNSQRIEEISDSKWEKMERRRKTQEKGKATDSDSGIDSLEKRHQSIIDEAVARNSAKKKTKSKKESVSKPQLEEDTDQPGPQLTLLATNASKKQKRKANSSRDQAELELQSPDRAEGVQISPAPDHSPDKDQGKARKRRREKSIADNASEQVTPKRRKKDSKNKGRGDGEVENLQDSLIKDMLSRFSSKSPRHSKKSA